MHIVGVVEIVAGLVVAVRRASAACSWRAGSAGIIVNLLLVGGYGDIALRDFGLLVGALALSRLASAHAGSHHLVPHPRHPGRAVLADPGDGVEVEHVGDSSSPSPAWSRTIPSGSTITLRPRPAGAAAFR